MTRRLAVAGICAVLGLVILSGAVAVDRRESRQASGGPAANGGPGAPAPAQKIDINTASAAELERLPGMTGKLPERIIAHRPYRKIDDLVRRKVLGRKQVAGIKEYITVGSAGSEPDRARSQ